MKLRVSAMLVVCGMVLCLIGVNVLTGLWIDSANLQYPGSMAVARKGPELAVPERAALIWQQIYTTQDTVETVRAWYATRLEARSGSPLNPGVLDGCAWLSQVRSVIVVTHSVSVMACGASGGTRVAVSQTVRLGP